MGNCGNLRELVSEFRWTNMQLGNIEDWSNENGAILNNKKCNVLHFYSNDNHFCQEMGVYKQRIMVRKALQCSRQRYFKYQKLQIWPT